MIPYYERDGIVIYCGECSQVMSQWEAESIDLTVTSPPYDNLREYRGYTFDFNAIAGQLWRVTAKGGVVVWVVGDATVNGSETGTSFRQALGFMGLGFNLHDTMIYEVNGTGAKGSHYAYWQAFEFMFVFGKGQLQTINRIRDKKNVQNGVRQGLTGPKMAMIRTRGKQMYTTPDAGIRTNIWRYEAGMASGGDITPHPAPFPEALARDHIISWSNPGDLVCDPMLGSGTTCKMAQHLGRRFVGCEISEEYCKIAADRLRQPSFFSIPDRPVRIQPEQATLFAE